VGKTRIITGFLALAVAGCVPARSAQSPKPMQLVEVIDAQLNARGALRWAKDRPLVPGDFRGTPPAAGGQEGAHTEYTIISGARCTGRTLEFHVTAAVLPAQSWMATELRRSPTEVARTLRHEQTHFDISEVYARRIRRKFAEMYDPCSFSEEALQEFSDKLVRDEAKEQSRYDGETNHGRTAGTQADWDRQVAAWLDSLSKYGQ
jgi:hypothetical protein